MPPHPPPPPNFSFFSYQDFFQIKCRFISHKTSTLICFYLSTCQCFYTIAQCLHTDVFFVVFFFFEWSISVLLLHQLISALIWKCCWMENVSGASHGLCVFFVLLDWFPLTSLPFSKKQKQSACLMWGFYSLHVALKVTAVWCYF